MQAGAVGAGAGGSQPLPRRGRGGCGGEHRLPPGEKDSLAEDGPLARIAEGTCELCGTARVSQAGHLSPVLPSGNAQARPGSPGEAAEHGAWRTAHREVRCRVSGAPPPQIFWKENESLTHSLDREVGAGPCPPWSEVLGSRAHPCGAPPPGLGFGHQEYRAMRASSPTCGDVVRLPCASDTEGNLPGVTGQSLQVPTPCPPLEWPGACGTARGARSPRPQPC